MKKEINRSERIPAFAIDLSQLEKLWQDLAALYEKSSERKGYIGVIKVALPQGSFEFESPAEMREHSSDLPKVISNFSFSMFSSDYADRRSLHFYALRRFAYADVSASGDSTAWCGGVLETVRDFFRGHRIWYHRLARIPLEPIALILAIVPAAQSAIFPHEPAFIHSRAGLVKWLVVPFALLFLEAFKGMLLPRTRLYITREENFFRQHSVELGLILTMVTIILGVIGLLGK